MQALNHCPISTVRLQTVCRLLCVLWWDSEWQRQMAVEMNFVSVFIISIFLVHNFNILFSTAWIFPFLNSLCLFVIDYDMVVRYEKMFLFFLNHPHFFLSGQKNASSVAIVTNIQKSTRDQFIFCHTQTNIWLINWKIGRKHWIECVEQRNESANECFPLKLIK